MSDLLKSLIQYGVNEDEVMERFVNDVVLYEECFIDLMEDVSFTKLDDAMKQGQYKQAFEYAHKLKGLTGNLGLAQLYKLNCSLVEALRKDKNKKAEGVYANFTKEYHKFKRLLAKSV